ncbi:MAG: hypothetical protein ABS922_15955 [Psychrobacillus psychrotolerans]
MKISRILSETTEVFIHKDEQSRTLEEKILLQLMGALVKQDHHISYFALT